MKIRCHFYTWMKKVIILRKVYTCDNEAFPSTTVQLFQFEPEQKIHLVMRTTRKKLNKFTLQLPVYYILEKEILSCAGFSINILHASDKSPVQRGFFNNGKSGLLHALIFLGRLFNFYNFVFIFPLM